MDTPWATTDTQRQSAVDGALRAFGPGPDFIKIGMFPSATTAMIGLYDSQFKPIAGLYSDGTTTCGRVSSLRFSREGKVGAHLLQQVGGAQFFYQATEATAQDLLGAQNRSFTWSTELVGTLSTNDMWFSDDRQAIDLSGQLWIADLASKTARQVSATPGALPGEFGLPAIVGKDVFVSRWVNGRSEYWIFRPEQLSLFRGATETDIKELVGDGTSLVWLEGNGSSTSDAGTGTAVFSSYSLYESPYTTDPTQLQPRVLASNVPSSLSHLELANGYIAGTYLISQPVYRSAALVVRLSDGEQLRSTLPDGYSWGYEVFPSASELWGTITPGPMVTFETVARVPYAAMASAP